MTIDQRQVGAHRVSLALDGRDPGPLDAIHSCDNPPCVNPAHLRPATTRENVADMIAKERGHWQNRQIVQVG